ncbi:MAG: hypothetical protein QOC77_812, partial [Thermoleophilaceae bacterium]|nr:hypothetical protein [Thermoleophilaceae bacterium]
VASPRQVTRAHRQVAARVAGRLLAGVVLPPGATKAPAEPAGDAHQLASSVFGMFFAAEIERHAFWTTSASPGTVIASFKAHLPPGAKPLGSGSGGGGAFAAYVVGGGHPYTLGARQLVVNAVTLANGTTGVRADAEVRYIAPRPVSQQIPASARVLQITQRSQGSAPLLSLTITRRSEVRRIAAMVDALPFVGKSTGAFSCPYLGAPLDTFVFRAGRRGRALASVSESAYTPAQASPCALSTLTIRGHRQAALLQGGVLLRQAGRLLGVRLTG